MLALLWAVLADSFEPQAGADQAILSETYAEKYACRWDCPIDIPDIPGLDSDDWREEFCERICGERLRVTASLKLVLVVPTLRHLDLSVTEHIRLSAGGLEFSFGERSRNSSNSVAVTQYRADETDDGDVVLRKAGSVVVSKRGDVLTIDATRTTAAESVVADQFTHHTGTLNGAINLETVPVRVEVGGLILNREIPVKALTTVKTNLVRIDAGEDEEVITEPRTYSTVKVSGKSDWPNPSLQITHPLPAQRWSNQVITASGTVISLEERASVLLQLNGAQEWMEIRPTNGLWNIPLTLLPGTNRIFACAKDIEGRYSPGVSVHIAQVRLSSLDLQVWPSSSMGAVTGASDGQLLEEGVFYRLTPAPVPGYLLEKWELQSPAAGTIQITGTAAPNLTFRHETNLQIRVYFVTNRFLTLPSKYAGLVAPVILGDPSEKAMKQGLIAFQLSQDGLLKGKYTTPAKATAFTSQVHPGNGIAQFVLDSGKSTEVAIALSFDLAHGRSVSGTLSGGAGWNSVVEAYPLASAVETVPFVGSHTFIIPAVDPIHAADLPAGHGAGTMKISTTGVVTGSGTAADGTKLTFAVPLLKHDDGVSAPEFFWPLFRWERGGGIVLRGFIAASATNTFDFASPLHWSRRPNFNDSLYPLGFDDSNFAAGGGLREWMMGRYIPPGPGANSPGFAHGRLSLLGGNLTAPLEIAVTIESNDRLAVTGLNPWQLNLKFSRNTGAFSGSFLHPRSGKKTTLSGAILQGSGTVPGTHAGFGWFSGWSETGAVVLDVATQ